MIRRNKILIIGDSPLLPSGMAETTRVIFETLLAVYPDHYALYQIGLFHCYAVTTPKWPIYPTKTTRRKDGELDFATDDRFGERTFREVLDRLAPDLVFAFNDPHNLLHLCLPANQRSYGLLAYTNLDGFPFHSLGDSPLQHADLIFTNSHFAVNVARHGCPEILPGRLGFMYSPADTRRFAVLAEPERAELRRDLLPGWMPRNAFVLGWIGRNQWRKQVWVFYKVLHYLRTGKYLVCGRCARVSLIDWNPASHCHLDEEKTVLESRPGYRYDRCIHCASTKVQAAEPMSDIYLWLHMPKDDPLGEWPLEWLEDQFDMRPGRDIHYTEGCGLKAALSPADMPTLYQIWDGLLFLSGGEGFGLPAWEAMCCGLPVIYTDYSSHAEFLGEANAGLPVGGFLQPEAGSCMFRMVADVSQAVQAVRQLYFDRALGERLGANGRAFVERFTPEIQAERWHRIFQGLVSNQSPGVAMDAQTRASAEI